MPIYEYRCNKCGHQREYLQRMSDAPLTRCPECGKRSFNKMMSAAGFQLKGTGWYATDFKNSGAKPAAKTTEAKSDKPADSGKPADSVKSAESAKPAASPSKESSKSESSTSAGVPPA